MPTKNLAAVLTGFFLCCFALTAIAKNQPAVPEPPGYRMDDFRKPVPATLEGARVVNTDEAEQLVKDNSVILIDVYPKPPKPAGLPAGTIWRDPQHETLPRAYWLPNVGFGALADGVEDYFRLHLEKWTTESPKKPLMFFCARNCWMSWNASKRALAMGFKNVIWYRDGSDGWQEAGNDLKETSSAP